MQQSSISPAAMAAEMLLCFVSNRNQSWQGESHSCRTWQGRLWNCITASRQKSVPGQELVERINKYLWGNGAMLLRLLWYNENSCFV